MQCVFYTLHVSVLHTLHTLSKGVSGHVTLAHLE